MSPKDAINAAVQDAPAVERRRFLSAAAKFSTVLAALGLGGKTVLAKSTDAAGGEALSLNLLQQAIQTGDMEGAIKSYKTELPLTDLHLKALRTLTAQDLNDLRRIQSKLDAAGGKFGLIWKKI